MKATRRERLPELLAAHGLSPRKRFGQHFLVDPNFARAVAAAAGADERTLLIEVGPGTGLLTRALLEAHPRARVLAIEIDRGLNGLLRAEFAGELAAGRVTLLEGDVLAGKHGLHPGLCAEALGISRHEDRPRRVLCANLPYNAATPLLANLALPGRAGPRRTPELRLVEKAVATVQLELARRILGAPGSADYGALAALLALRTRGRLLRKAGPEIFWPRPQVQSAVLELEYLPWPESGLHPEEAAPFQRFVQKLFQHRRKTLRAALGGGLAQDDPLARARAEDLPPEELLSLFRALTEGETKPD